MVETPTYDLTMFQVHYGKMTLKIYTKGERVLRIEVIVHMAVVSPSRAATAGARVTTVKLAWPAPSAPVQRP